MRGLSRAGRTKLARHLHLSRMRNRRRRFRGSMPSRAVSDLDGVGIGHVAREGRTRDCDPEPIALVLEMMKQMVALHESPRRVRGDRDVRGEWVTS